MEAVTNILNYTDGKTRDELEADKISFYGIVKNIEIIGEASYKLTHAFRRQHPDTPWEFITKMRHVLLHDYYQLEPREIWSVVHNDLHLLREQVARYLADTDWEEWEKNSVVAVESAVHKNIVQTARRMKRDGMEDRLISRYTGLPVEDIEML